MKNFKTCVILIGMLGIGGCEGTLSGAGPYKSAIESSSQVQNYTLVDINAATIGPFMSPSAKAPIATIVSQLANPIRLMGGDEISVLVTDNSPEGAGLFAPLSQGGTQFKVRVDSDGMISLPYVGRHFVAGMTPFQVEDLIKTRLKGVTSDVQAHVDLSGDLAGSILVAGAVKSPGRFSTLQGPLTVLDVVNQAGGPLLEPHLVNIVVRNGGEVISVNYEDVLSGRNFALKPRSEVVVERARQRFVAMGAVSDPGLHDLPAQNTSLLDALGSVGGLKEASANPGGVFVFRADPSAPTKPVVLRLDMRDPAAIFYARQVMLKPDDTLYVTNAAVHEWQKIISPIVQTLVLGRTMESFQ